MQLPSPFDLYCIDTDGNLFKSSTSLGQAEPDLMKNEAELHQVKPWRSKTGYLCCNIWNSQLNKVQPCVYIHRLMQLAYFPNQVGQCDHINRVKTDNRLENLRVVSASENLRNRNPWRWSTSARLRLYMRNMNAPDYFEKKLLKIVI